jgi:glycine dehydrogenase subunit 2
MTGVMLIRAFLDQRDGEASKDRRVMLIPDSAHGTNPASAAMSGFTVKTIRSTAEGLTDMDHLREVCDQGGVAGLMLTNPNTVGIFETNIKEICDVIHTAGGLVYMDGANMNALVGIARPGDMGVDVIHSNLHKNISTPHGGGARLWTLLCTAELPRFCQRRVSCQTPSVSGGRLVSAWTTTFPRVIGRVKAFLRAISE